MKIPVPNGTDPTGGALPIQPPNGAVAPGLPMPTDPLVDLRGYHLPDPVSWWPPAPGWWLLALLGLVFVAAALVWLIRRYRRGAAARAARAALAELRDDLARGGDSAAFARGLSRLLRRFALTRYPHGQVAGLSGEDWLAFLDANGGDGRFSDGPGRLLIEAPYRPTIELPADALADLAGQWIASNGGGFR